MRKSSILILLSACFSCAQAQPHERPYNGNFHAFGVMGACQHGYGLFGGGGGAEGLVWKGITLGADVSYQAFTDGWGFGMVSGQVGYHFVNRSQPLKWDPFVTYGMGGVFGSKGGMSGTARLGGGFNYWFKPRMAVRVEFRAHGMPDEVLATARIGVSFR